MKTFFDNLTKEQLYWAAALLLLPALFLNLGVQPLFLEEPRRVLIGLEMLQNGNLWMPTELGEPYYKKPALFNWLLMAAGALFGYQEWAFRLPTVLATLGLAGLTGWMGRRYVDADFGWLSGLLFVTGAGIFFYFSTLAEIDLVYSFLTFASFAALFHFYEKKQFYPAFLLFYFLSALGTLTKGLPSIFFLGLTLLAWLSWKREWKRLFQPPNLLGALLYLLIVGGYLWQYARFHDLGLYFEGAWGQNAEFTVLENRISSLFVHLLAFPLSTLQDLLPAALLVVFLLRLDLWQVIRHNEYMVFALLVFGVNIPVYWLSPGAAQRYIYMLYPFLVYLMVYAYRAGGFSTRWRSVFLRVMVGVITGALALGSLAINFVPDLAFLDYRLPLSIAGFILFGLLFWLYLRRPGLNLPVLILVTIFARLLFDLTVLPQRAHDSKARADRALAQRVVGLTGDAPLYIYDDQRISFTTVVYLDLLREDYLRRHPGDDPEAFYFIEKASLQGKEGYEKLLSFEYSGREYYLVSFHGS